MKREKPRKPNPRRPETAKVRDIWAILSGKDGRLGMTQKVAVMWQIHIWVALASGGLGGSVITAFTLKCMGLLK